MCHKIIVSDDHDMYRDGLVSLLSEVVPDAKLYQAADFYTTKDILAEHSDMTLAVLDLQMPGSNGLQALTEIKENYPFLTVVVVSSQDLAVRVQKILDIGADGFIAKSTTREPMLSALKRIFSGELVVVSEVLDDQIVLLTPRQQTILEFMAAGKPNKEIATSLGISDATVREHVSLILRNLKVSNRVQAINEAKRLGYVVADF